MDSSRLGELELTERWPFLLCDQPGFEAQTDAVSVIFSAKIGANPENTVGVMTMGGAGGKGYVHDQQRQVEATTTVA